jgi:hypothetical protein
MVREEYSSSVFVVSRYWDLIFMIARASFTAQLLINERDKNIYLVYVDIATTNGRHSVGT